MTIKRIRNLLPLILFIALGCEANSDLTAQSLADSKDYCAQRETVDKILTQMGNDSFPTYNQVEKLFENAQTITLDDPWLINDKQDKPIFWRFAGEIANRSLMSPDGRVMTKAGDLAYTHTCDRADLALVLSFTGSTKSLKLTKYSFQEVDNFAAHRVEGKAKIDSDGLKLTLHPYLETDYNGNISAVCESYYPNLKVSKHVSESMLCRRLADNRVNLMICHGGMYMTDIYNIFTDGKTTHTTTKLSFGGVNE